MEQSGLDRPPAAGQALPRAPTAPAGSLSPGHPATCPAGLASHPAPEADQPSPAGGHIPTRTTGGRHRRCGDTHDQHPHHGMRADHHNQHPGAHYLGLPHHDHAGAHHLDLHHDDEHPRADHLDNDPHDGHEGAHHLDGDHSGAQLHPRARPASTDGHQRANDNRPGVHDRPAHHHRVRAQRGRSTAIHRLQRHTSARGDRRPPRRRTQRPPCRPSPPRRLSRPGFTAGRDGSPQWQPQARLGAGGLEGNGYCSAVGWKPSCSYRRRAAVV
jgi:hypothetical protein